MGTHINALLHLDTPQKWLLSLINYKGLKLPYNINSKTYLPLSLWNIWITRNRNIHDGIRKSISINFTTQRAIEFSYLAASYHKVPQRIMTPLKWIPPKPDIYKLNTDEAHSSTLNIDGIGGLIRNHHGNWIVGFSGKMPSQSSISAELYALIQGLRIGIQHNLSPLYVEIDANKVITMLDCEIQYMLTYYLIAGTFC